MTTNREHLYEIHPAEGVRVGRDPRKVSVDEFAAAGIERVNRTDAIRAKCLDCCAGSFNEVRLCVSTGCALWPFRMGTDPWRTPMSAERREAVRARAGQMRAARTDLNNHKGQNVAPGGPATHVAAPTSIA